MNKRDRYSLVPASPELQEKFLKTKKFFFAGKSLPEESTLDILDLQTFTFITSRPKRIHSASPELAPVVGTRRALVLLADFSDKVATQSKGHYKDMLFSSGTYATGSLRDFYWEASYHKLTVTGDVSGGSGGTNGWYRAPQPYSYYTDGNFGTDGAYPHNAQKLVEDVVDLAAGFVNFADYDNDGDGFVDALFIVHAGPGAEATGNRNDIWSHQWEISPKTVDGVKVQTYTIEPEDGNVGVFCHELMHAFGLPDLYDVDSTSAGTGGWDLMAAGSWNNGGLTPAHPTSYCKVKLGWIDPVSIFNAQQSVTLKPYATTDKQVYKLPIGDINSKEYFLLSNRQQIGFDSQLPGKGLIIEHIDENKTTNSDETHYLVDVEQCDGRLDLNKNANRGDATDAFPCGATAEFTVSTNPSSKAYNGSDSKVAVTNIQLSGDNITADIKIGTAESNVGAEQWYYNKKVKTAFTHHTSQWAWAEIDGLGLRRIKDGAPDAVTNIFNVCCQALANNREVNVYADGSFIYTIYLL